jgi:hypothetical protein
VDDSHVISFDQLADADLVVNRVYRGGAAGNTSDDPLPKLLPVGDQGGFRAHGRTVQDSVKLVVLYTSGAEPDWPDVLDPYTGTSLTSGTTGHQAATCTTRPRKETSC